jgi:hypothetical protein
MARQGMGKTMGNPACEWVRARLPLWVGDDDKTERSGEGDDLRAADRQEIERHLRGCAGCRRHRAALEQALRALGAVAAHCPIDPQTPSLWPALEHRIEWGKARMRTPWRETTSGIFDWWIRGWAVLGGNGPLWQAWTRDRRKRQDPQWKGRTAWLWVLSSAAALIIALVGIPRLHLQWRARSTIATNPAPLADRVIPSATPIEEQPVSEISGTDADRAIPSNELARAELVRTPEAPASGAESTPAPRLPSPRRYGYDLEHGIPMLPDARESKQVY